MDRIIEILRHGSIWGQWDQLRLEASDHNPQTSAHLYMLLCAFGTPHPWAFLIIWLTQDTSGPLDTPPWEAVPPHCPPSAIIDLARVHRDSGYHSLNSYLTHNHEHKTWSLEKHQWNWNNSAAAELGGLWKHGIRRCKLLKLLSFTPKPLVSAGSCNNKLRYLNNYLG